MTRQSSFDREIARLTAKAIAESLADIGRALWEKYGNPDGHTERLSATCTGETE